MTPIDTPPFWELRTGGGPHTERIRAHEEARERAERRTDDLDLHGVVVRTRRPPELTGLSYKELRERGICTVCYRPSIAARCLRCAEKLSQRRTYGGRS